MAGKSKPYQHHTRWYIQLYEYSQLVLVSVVAFLQDRSTRVAMTHSSKWHEPRLSGRRSRQACVLAMVTVVTAIAISFLLPSLFTLQGRSTSKLCSCETTTFPRRSVEQEAQFSAAWRVTVDFVKSRSLTFLHDEVLEFHRSKLSEIETKGIPGMIFECGVAKAGSAITFASYKHPKRCLHLFDTFDGIPQPSEKDGPDVLARYTKIQSDKERCEMGLPDCDRDYYGNMDNLLAYDMAQFEIAGYKHSKHAVYFHKGLFDDTVWPVGPVAYAHLDGDWYDSTYHMLERLSPHLSTGGYFVLDDVYYWSGAKNAYADYFLVRFEWLENLKEGCWTVVTCADGRRRYFRLMLDVRATAQAIDPVFNTSVSFPQCSEPPPPAPTD